MNTLPLEIREAIAEAGYDIPPEMNPYKVGREERYNRIEEDNKK